MLLGGWGEVSETLREQTLIVTVICYMGENNVDLGHGRVKSTFVGSLDVWVERRIDGKDGEEQGRRVMLHPTRGGEGGLLWGDLVFPF